MSNEHTATDLSLISTQELIDELFDRSPESLLIQEALKAPSDYIVDVRTPKGPYASPVLNFDIVTATQMLQTAQALLLTDHLKSVNEDDKDDSDGPPEPEQETQN